MNKSPYISASGKKIACHIKECVMKFMKLIIFPKMGGNKEIFSPFIGDFVKDLLKFIFKFERKFPIFYLDFPALY